MKEPEMVLIAQWVGEVLTHRDDEAYLAELKGQVREFCKGFPMYASRLED
jgi:glycine hydroxymethyltransferase